MKKSSLFLFLFSFYLSLNNPCWNCTKPHFARTKSRYWISKLCDSNRAIEQTYFNYILCWSIVSSWLFILFYNQLIKLWSVSKPFSLNLCIHAFVSTILLVAFHICTSEIRFCISINIDENEINNFCLKYQWRVSKIVCGSCKALLNLVGDFQME